MARNAQRRGLAAKRQLTPERQADVEALRPLARLWAKPYKESWPQWREEFESAASLALVEAALTYDVDRGIKFGSYARFRIVGALRDTQEDLRHVYQLDGTPGRRLMELRGNHEECGKVVLATFDEPVGTVFEAEEFVEKSLEKLPPRHAAICREIYVNGKNQQETAKSMGFSRSRVSALHKEAIDILRESWETRIANMERREEYRHD